LEWYQKNGGIFVIGMVSFEVVGGQSVVYVFAELFGSEMSGVPYVNVEDCLGEEVFVPIYFHGV
jgi:hypothetical protein